MLVFLVRIVIYTKAKKKKKILGSRSAVGDVCDGGSVQSALVYILTSGTERWAWTCLETRLEQTSINLEKTTLVENDNQRQ